MDDAVVAEDDREAAAERDRVGTEASEDDVVRARLDRVGRAEGAGPVDVREHVVLYGLVHVHLAVVAEDDVLAAARRSDRV